MNFRILVLFFIITAVFGTSNAVTAQQIDTVIGQFTNSGADSFAGGISGDGRFVVIESRGDIATVNPRNADGNREIFLFDYAQRRIFQITDTQPLLTNAANSPTFENIKVEILNIRPVISNDGRWIAFGSNATVSNTTNPGNFNANALSDADKTALAADGNTEMWLYLVPSAPAADLTSGEELAVTDLSRGSFTRLTNSPASRVPVAATTTTGAFISDDNHDASISDDGNVIAFASTRNLAANNADFNDEIFTYVRSLNKISQITTTARGTIARPVYSVSPTVSGSGNRIAFTSTANLPTVTATGGNNADNNEEVFYANVGATGEATGTVQVTATAQTNAGDLVNVWNFGRRMSRDGRYIAFDSFADLANENGGANQTSFALYVFDTTSSAFRRIAPRSDADAAAAGGDVFHYPTFTSSNGTTIDTLVFTTRLNITAAGAVPATATDGLNSLAARPAQIYSYSLTDSPASFRKLTMFPTPSTFLASTQAITSNSVRRLAFNLALTEIGTGNPDLASESFYLFQPTATATNTNALSYQTGASRLTVTASPVPTPTASPSPTPQTPSAVQGVSPGSLVVVNLAGTNPAVTPRVAVGSLARSFTLPIQLSGVTVTINGTAAGIRSVSNNQVEFVVPPGLTASTTAYPIIINNNGTVTKGEILLVGAQPDIFTNLATPGIGGRARVFNVTNTVPTTEPFAVTTIRRKGGTRVPTVLRVYLTGVNNVSSSAVTIRIGSTTISGTSITTNAVLREPGVYSFDFTLPAALARAGDQPIIVTLTVGGVNYSTRLDDTAPRLTIF